MINEITWKDGEQKVQEYMKKLGFKILLTNFSCVGVELDIVSILPKKEQIEKLKIETKQKVKRDRKNRSIYVNSLKSMLNNLDDLLVITEVKARANVKFGLGLESISDYKKHNLIRGARYLQTQQQFEKYQIRFDVASVDNGKITYIENVF